MTQLCQNRPILILAAAITMLPLAACIARDELNVAADFALGHYTHEKSSVGCAAALARPPPHPSPPEWEDANPSERRKTRWHGGRHR